MSNILSKYVVVKLIFLVIFSYVLDLGAVEIDDNCTVNILNRTVQVDKNGSWNMPNVPSFMGRVRARVSCISENETYAGESEYFNVAINSKTEVSKFVFSVESIPPTKLEFFEFDTINITLTPSSYQLRIIAFYLDDHKKDVTSDKGINYISSNKKIVSVNSQGLVTAKQSGSVLITARLDGVIAVQRISVTSSGDTDGDGLPDDYEEANALNSNDPTDAFEDQDKDGLSALEEYKLGTDPHKADTDGDGISDGEEIKKGKDGFITNPLLADTDGDGLNDYVETLVKSDPTDAKSANFKMAIQSIAVEPKTVVLTFNSVNTEVSQQLTALAQLIDKTELDITAKSIGTNYKSSDLSIVSFSATDGKIFGGKVGKATVTVENNGYKATVEVEVNSFVATALAAIDIPGYANNVDVLGNYAYVAAGASGLVVVDVTDKKKPKIVATLDTTGTSIDIRIVGNIAYIADGEAGLQTIDISNPLKPKLLATFDTAGIAQDIKVDFQYAYIADGNNGLEIVNISDPSNPLAVAQLGGLDDAKGVDIEGDTVVIVSGRALHVIDVKDRSGPVLEGSINIGSVKDVVIRGDYAYVAAYSTGYRVIDIGDPRAPVIVAGDRSFVPRDVELSGDLAFFAEQLFPNVVAYVNIQDPASAVFQGTIDLSNFGDYAGTGIALDSRYAYITEESHVVSSDYKATGKTRLFIAQYLMIQDNLGVAPTVSMNSPKSTDILVEGTNLLVDITATDDISVASVDLLLNGKVAFTDTTTPYQAVVPIPVGTTTLSVAASATDLGNNKATTKKLDFTVQKDTDKDGLGDGQEKALGTKVNKADTDDDGLNDGKEIAYGTNPLKADSDGDGIKDGKEVQQGTDPLNPDITAPKVDQVTPKDKAEDIPETSSIGITFNEALQAKSVKRSVVELKVKSSGVVVTGSVKLSTDKKTITFKPAALLKDYTLYTLKVSAVKDSAGNPLSSSFSSGFKTGNVVDEVAPKILKQNPKNNATSVPVNTIIALQFDEPIDKASITEDNFIIIDTTTNAKIAGTRSLSEDATVLSFIPDTAFLVGRSHRIYLNKIADLFGNKASSTYLYFTTAFVADADAPQITDFSIAEGLKDVPINAVIQVGFNEAINPLKLTQITLSSGGKALPLTRLVSADHRIITLKLAKNLEKNTLYNISVSDIEDLGGNILANTIERRFTTGDIEDKIKPTRISYQPSYDTAVPPNTAISLTLSERINPLGVHTGNIYLQDQTDGKRVEGVFSLSADGRTINFVPQSLLKINHRYYLYYYYSSFPYLVDIAGNRFNRYSYHYFTVTGSEDNVAPKISSTGLLPDAKAIPINTRVTVSFDEPVQCISANTVKLVVKDGSTVEGKITLSSDRRIVTFKANKSLSVSTIYTLVLDGVCDFSGNILAKTEQKFTTSDSANADTTRPNVTVSPVNNSTDIAVDTPIVFNFSEVIDPNTLGAIAIYIGNSRVAGSLTFNSQRTVVTFKPLNTFPTKQKIRVYFNGVTDLVGNSAYSDTYFTTVDNSDVADKTAPTILSVVPNANAVGIDTASKVVLTFSESLNEATLAGSNFALFANGSRLSTGVSRSSDNRTITLSASLPPSTLISVIATDDIKDLSGNALKDSISLFTTASATDLVRPRVVTQYPGNGATGVAINRPIVLYINESIDQATLTDNFYVAQNGVLVAGSTTVSADGHILTFNPTQSWVAGSLIEVFIRTGLQDTAGNAMNAHQGSFRIAVDSTTFKPNVLSYSPAYNSKEVPLNPVIDIWFNEPLEVGSVDDTSVELRAYSGNKRVSSSISLLRNNRLIRIKPSAELSKETRYTVYITGIKDLEGNSYSRSRLTYFTTTQSADKVAPSVDAISPRTGQVDVGVNAHINMRFDEVINPLSLRQETDFIGSLNFSNSNRNVEYIPHTPFATEKKIKFDVSTNIEDLAGNKLTAHSTTFTTAKQPDFTRPSVVQFTPYRDATEVAVNALIQMDFDEAIDPLSLNTARFYLYDTKERKKVAGRTNLSENGKSLIFVPEAALLVSRRYSVYAYDLRDLAGNVLNYSAYYHYFTTGMQTDKQPPTVKNFSIAKDLDNVPTNALLQVAFDEALNEHKLDDIHLQANGEDVFVKVKISSDHRYLTLAIMKPLDANTLHTLTIKGIEDLSGNALKAVATYQFTTEAGLDLLVPVRSSFQPAYDTAVPSNTKISITFNERMNPLGVHEGNFYVQDETDRKRVQGRLSLSDDGRTVSFIPKVLLKANHRYYFYYYDRSFPYTSDIAGNRHSRYSYHYFTVREGEDKVAPEISSTGIPANAKAIPVNARVTVSFNEPVQCLSNATVQLLAEGKVIEGTISLSSDKRIITFKSRDLLEVKTSYTLVLNGICDFAGNTLVKTTQTFTTSDSSNSDNTRPSVTVSPVNNATDIAVDTAIVFNFSEAIDPNTLGSIAITIGNSQVAGNLTVNAKRTVVTFKPLNTFPIKQKIRVYFRDVTDLVGNSAYSNTYFTTVDKSDVADKTAPKILSIMPKANAVEIDTASKVILTFSESLNESTLNNKNFALFANGVRLGTSISHSSDNRTITLSASLPPSTLISVIATDDIKDLSDNALKDSISLFTTVSATDLVRPRVVTQYPGNGATGVAINRPIVLYVNETIDQSTLTNNFFVSQNGVLVTGSTTVSADGHILTFNPTQSWIAGSLIEIFIRTGLQDRAGNGITAHQGSFRTATDSTTFKPSVLSYSPTYNRKDVPLNPVIDIWFNEPLEVGSVDDTSVELRTYSENKRVSSSISLLRNNRLIRIKPSAELSKETRYTVYITGIKDLEGNSYSRSRLTYFTTSQSADKVAPSVDAISPTTGQIDVGVNAHIHLRFDEVVNPLTLRQETDFIGSLNFSNNNREVEYIPHTPFVAEKKIQFDVSRNIEDLAGNKLTAYSTIFTTAKQPDYTRPNVIKFTPYRDATEVAVNALLQMDFDEAIDPLTLTTDRVYLYDEKARKKVAGQVNLSDNGKTLTFVPDQALLVSRRHYFYVYNLRDLAGNVLNNSAYYYHYFTTKAVADKQAPKVSNFSLAKNLTNVPTNALLQLVFDEALNEHKLENINLQANGENVSTKLSISSDHRYITLILTQPLDANTLHVLTIKGIEDLSGNVLKTTVKYQFTTGAGADLLLPVRSSYQPASNTSVPPNARVSITFNERINPLSVHPRNFYLQDETDNERVEGGLSLSTDGRKVSFTPKAVLETSHRYYFYYYRNAFPYTADIAGNRYSHSSYHRFSVAGTEDNVAPKMSSLSMPASATAVPVNTRISALFNEAVQCITSETVQLVDDGSVIAGKISLSSDRRIITFKSNELLNTSTIYTFVLNGICDFSGNTAGKIERKFTTSNSLDADTTRPTLTTMVPVQGATGIAVDTNITFTFSEAMDAVSIINNLSIKVDSVAISGAFTFNATHTKATFTPSEDLPAGKRVSIYTPYTVYDLAGNYLYLSASFDTSATASSGLNRWLSQVVYNQRKSDDDWRSQPVIFSEVLKISLLSHHPAAATRLPTSIPKTEVLSYLVSAH